MPELSRKDSAESVRHYLGVVGLTKYASHRPNQLSGGQRQRVAIARALATHSKSVLADEPTANIDSKTGSSILKLMRDINRESRTTFVFSTHDRKVMNMADRLVRIADGQITALGMKADDRWVFVEERAPREDETPEI